MGGVKRSRFERREVEKVTLDWVKTNCKLTSREYDLLEIVYDRKLVRRDHLEVISESYRDLDSIHKTRILNRSISKLYQGMILDKIHETREFGKGDTPAIISLDKGGSLLLGLPHKKRIIHKTRIVNDEKIIQRYLPSNYRHINGVNKLEVDTILLLKDTENILSMWKHEHFIKFHYGQEKIRIIPDVICRIDRKSRDKPLLLFIEFDTGSESLRYKEPPIIREKVSKYRKYQVSKLWLNDYDYFPILLLVTEDNKRIPYFNEKCKESGVFGFGVYHESYVKFITHLISTI